MLQISGFWVGMARLGLGNGEKGAIGLWQRNLYSSAESVNPMAFASYIGQFSDHILKKLNHTQTQTATSLPLENSPNIHLATQPKLPNMAFSFKTHNFPPAPLMQLTQDQILQLAPDAASAKAGTQLATTAKWTQRNAHPAALWGDCQGSGSKPYLTMVDLGNMAFKCSCPSRKFPCKHGLGLLLLYAAQANSFTQ